MTKHFSLPSGDWMPRSHQEKLWQYLETGGKRAVAMWHRRAGKDEICLHHAAARPSSASATIGIACPSSSRATRRSGPCQSAYRQAAHRRSVSARAAREHSGQRDVHPLKNGSTWQVIGSDRYDATVGASVVGITYSEFALSKSHRLGLSPPDARGE